MAETYGLDECGWRNHGHHDEKNIGNKTFSDAEVVGVDSVEISKGLGDAAVVAGELFTAVAGVKAVVKDGENMEEERSESSAVNGNGDGLAWIDEYVRAARHQFGGQFSTPVEHCLKNLENRIAAIENVLKMNQTTDDQVSQGKTISKQSFRHAILEAMHSPGYPYGVSKMYLKSFLSQMFGITFSLHYTRKLNFLLSELTRDGKIRFDSGDGLFKIKN